METIVKEVSKLFFFFNFSDEEIHIYESNYLLSCHVIKPLNKVNY